MTVCPLGNVITLFQFDLFLQ